jgi:hypothetical protein
VNEFVEVPLPHGLGLIVESDDVTSGTVLAGRLHDLAESATETFESAMNRLGVAAGAVISRMHEMAQQPDEVTVQFAVKLATQAGVVIANTSAEANLSVTLKWTAASGHETPVVEAATQAIEQGALPT